MPGQRYTEREPQMRTRKIHASKRHPRAKSWLEPLPLDPRDRDIIRAKRLARPRPPGR